MNSERFGFSVLGAWGFGANPAMHYSLPIYRFNYGSKALLWRLLIGI